MATAPIVVVWASTTSNKDTLDTTTQGNGIVFESDIVSDFLNSALYINSQATRNLQVMGGYYDAGQSYKNYQYCSQVLYDGTDYVLNYYMATQDDPSLAPTNGSSFQTGTTDMQIPTNASSVQSGWRKINILPNQSNLIFANTNNTFTGSNTFNGNVIIGDSSSDTCTINSTTTIPNLSNSTLKSGATLNANSGVVKAGGVSFNLNGNTESQIQIYGTQALSSSSDSNSFYNRLYITLPKGSTASEDSLIIVAKDTSNAYPYSYSQIGGESLVSYNRPSSSIQAITSLRSVKSSDYGGSSTSFLGVTYTDTSASPRISSTLLFSLGRFSVLSKTIQGLYIRGYASSFGEANLFYGVTSSQQQVFVFKEQTTITNASFGTMTFALDPVWAQDYATANYVNQKTLSLYDEIDARLSAIEEKLGIPKVASRGVDIKTRLASMEVAKSPITELFERIDSMEEYKGVLGYSNEEERLALSKAIGDEETIMQIVNGIKARMQEEQAQKEKEAQAQAQQEQQTASPKTRSKTKAK